MRTRLLTGLGMSLLLLATLTSGACATKNGVNQPGDKPTFTKEELEARKKEILESYREKAIREVAEARKDAELDKAAKAEIEKADDATMKKTRKDLERAENESASRMRDFRQREIRASVLGCRVGTVDVADRMISGSMLKIPVSNELGDTVDITTTFRDVGVAVTNLCGGGSLIFKISISRLQTNGENIVFTAKPRKGGPARTFTVTIQNQTGGWQNSQPWTIR